MQALDLAGLVLDPDRHVHILDDGAGSLLEERCLLRLKNASLALSSSVAGQALLHELLTEALSHDDAFRPSQCILRETSSGKVTGLRVARLLAPATMFAPPVPHALVLIITPERREPLPSADLRTGLGLTTAEASVARHLQTGFTVSKIAVQHQADRETVRAQLKSIFDKTGVSRQPDLLRLLERLT